MTSQGDLISVRMHRGAESVKVVVHLATLTDDIASRGSILPQDEILVLDRWTPVGEFPGPWIARLLELAIQATRELDFHRIEVLAERILAYARNHKDVNAICCARFLQAQLRSCEGDHRAAVELLEQSLRGRSSITAAAHNNLAVAWVHLRNPLAAMKEFQLALAHDPGLIVPYISMRELAATMIDEMAPNLDGRPSWPEVQQQAVEKLRSVDRSRVDRFLDPYHTFPGFQVLQVFSRGTYFPPISCALAGEQAGVLGAEALLSRAEGALAARKYASVSHLSQKAARVCPSLAGAASEIEAEATAKLNENRWLVHAEQYADNLDAFLAQLDNLTLDDLDLPREYLALLRADAPNFEALRRLYHRRIGELAAEKLRETRDDDHRDFLLQLCRQYGAEDSRKGYEQAARTRLAASALRQFRQALRDTDLETARTSLHRAGQLLGDDLGEERAMFDELQKSDKLLRSQISLEGCLKAERAMEQINMGDFQEAQESLCEILLSEPDAEEVVRIQRNLSSAETLQQSHQLIRGGKGRAARRKLKTAIRKQPGNRDALVLMVTLDLLTSNLAGTDIERTAKDGTAAIDEFLNSDHDAFRKACDALDETLRKSWVIQFLESISHRRQSGR